MSCLNLFGLKSFQTRGRQFNKTITVVIHTIVTEVENNSAVVNYSFKSFTVLTPA